MNTLPSPTLTFVTELRIKVAKPVDVGDVPAGRRRVIEILGGDFDGPLLKGTIIPGGADWQIIRRDDVAQLEAKYMLKTEDGVLVYISNTGLRHGPPDVMRKLSAGEPVPPESYYFWTTPVFETSAPQYEWLQKHIFIAQGIRHPDRVVVRVWRVG
jgi:hypothetical protein